MERVGLPPGLALGHGAEVSAKVENDYVHHTL